MAKVELKKINKRFQDGTVALNDFTLTIEDGEFVVLVGPSGCGKSTTLRLLAGLEQPTAGEIFINGENATAKTPQQRNVAMVFQNYALYPHMTVRGNIEFPLKMMKMPLETREQKVMAIADVLNLGDLLDRKPKQLSGGERQRVAMGRALVRDPSVFLLDEPLSNLDAELRSQIRADIARTQRTLNKTTLYVTHDQVEAMTLGDRVVVMNNGEIQQVGSPTELYEKPKNIFVAKFIGNPGMNIIPAQLHNSDNGEVFAVSTDQIPITKMPANPVTAKNIGRQIHFGIRPESIKASQFNAGVSLLVTIESVEFLGHESLIYFSLRNSDDNHSGLVLTARMPGQFSQTSTPHTKFFINPDEIYLFNSAGEIIG